MKISIITIVLNDEENIEKTILSIINQFNTRNNLEYILIDGGSTDGTLEILNKYTDKIDIMVSEKDKGIADAFNKGISLASGEIIGIVNSGDWLEEDSLNKIKKYFDKNVDIVYGDVQYWLKNKKEYKYSANHKLLDKFMSVNHPAVFVKKTLYQNNGLFKENYKVAMDYELILRFFVGNGRFKYLPTVLSNMSLGGISDINWKDAYKEAYEIRKTYLGNSFSLYLDYKIQVLKRYISNILTIIGLEKLKKYYRERFSQIKKEKHETNI